VEKTFKIMIDCNNAAFDGRAGSEIARILRGLAIRFESMSELPEDGLERVEKDRNGNSVATWDYV